MKKISFKSNATSSLFALCLILLSSCSPKKDISGVLRFRLPTDPANLDWTLATDNVSREVLFHYMVGLVRLDSATKVEADLAESWSLSKDAKTYTFKLRPNLKWSDGSDLVAQDFVDSWERLLNPKTAAEYAYFLYDVVGAEDYSKGTSKDFSKVSAKATDPQTFVVTLKKPIAYWIQLCAFWPTFPIKKEVVEKYGNRWIDPVNAVTAGPYNLKVVERDSRIVLERNPLYWEASELKNMVPRLEFRIIKDDATAVTLFKRGELDIVRDLPPVQVRELSKLKEYHAAPFLRSFYLGFNIKDASVSNPTIRRAISAAIDRKELDTVLGSTIQGTTSWIPPGLVGYNEERGTKFDPDLAKKLWDSVKGPKPTSIEFVYDTKDLNKVVAENVQSQLKKNLGLDTTISNQEWKVYIKQVRTKTPAMYRMGWGADYPDPDTFMNLFTCGSQQNWTKFCNKRYDELISLASGLTDDGPRAKAYDEAQKILLEDEVAIVPLFTQTNLHLVAQRVDNFRVDLIGNLSLKNFRLK